MGAQVKLGHQGDLLWVGDEGRSVRLQFGRSNDVTQDGVPESMND